MNMYIVMLKVASSVSKYYTISSSAGRNISVASGANMLSMMIRTINAPSLSFIFGPLESAKESRLINLVEPEL